MSAAIPMLDLPRLHRPLATAFHGALDELLESGAFIGGEAVARFESELAARVGAAHAVGTSSGTDALLAGLMALGLKPGDEIATTPYTFFATAGVIHRQGAKPVFADIDPATFNVDPAALEAAITPRTVGIVPVHLFGQCADMGRILDTAARHGLWVLEDAAQAIGAQHGGRQAGTMGALGAFSFFPAKNLGALGDGGAVVTNDAALADRLRVLREHGARPRYHHALVGGNFRLDALQAAFLSAKLPALAGWEEGRRRVVARYGELLAGVRDLVLPDEMPGNRHVWNQYVVRTPRREAVVRALASAGVGHAVYYPVPLHLQECFAALGYEAGAFPESERAARETLALPIDPLLEAVDQERVAAAVRGALEDTKKGDT
ncbi:MAG: DegT/DnrJ/EryC1/StrS family aminotransferase [Deltaproteobacteria bacterium]|nr:DegT/DnrJ/EryC1/StrS family aminotransferase [Deltaproteobacteria bacterium]